MKKALVAYATMAGSTGEVALVISEAFTQRGWQVEVSQINEVKDLTGYDGVVVGGPMIMGWHRQALRFVRKNRAALQRVPLAVFVTAMSLTRTPEMGLEGVSVFVDSELPKPPQNPARLSFRERYTRLANYLRPILRAFGPERPVSVGVFGGRLEYGRLPWWGVLFAMLVIQAPAGDRRNWDAIRSWAERLPEAMTGDL